MVTKRRTASSTSRPRTPRKTPSLEEVLAYENPRVVRGFLRKYDLGRGEANLLFREVLKLLWAHGARGAQIHMFGPWELLDEMWHAFILHTADYEAFCLRYFGRMLHHEPETHGGRAPSVRAIDQKLEAGVDTVWSTLGPETANLWFHDFWRRYTPAFLDRCSKRRVARPRARRASA